MRSAVMVYTGGSSEYSVPHVSGGYVMEEVSIKLSCRGGEAGGVAGSPPGEHTGMCLFGIAAGAPRAEVLSDKCGGGVEERTGMAGTLATAAAMMKVGQVQPWECAVRRTTLAVRVCNQSCESLGLIVANNGSC